VHMWTAFLTALEPKQVAFSVLIG